MCNPNLIYGPVSPKFTAGVQNTAKLCDILVIECFVLPAQYVTLHECVDKGIHSKLLACWELTVFVIDEKPCSTVSDLIPDDSPIIMGLDKFPTRHADVYFDWILANTVYPSQ